MTDQNPSAAIMLELKSNLAFHTLPNQAARTLASSIADLPPEILELVLVCLYQDCHRRLDSILPLSRTCWQLRKSTLPLLFESVSFVIRDWEWALVHPTFSKIASYPHLLKLVKTLHLRRPLGLTGDIEICDAEAKRNRQSDVAVLDNALRQIPQLQQIRLHCSLATAIDVLRILQDRPWVTIVFDHVSRSTASSSSDDGSHFLHLLRGRTIALGSIYILNPPPLPHDTIGSDGITRLAAIDLGVQSFRLAEIPFEKLIGNSSSPTFPNDLSGLSELWLGQLESSTPAVTWSEVLQAVPWARLRRLRIQGAHLQRRLRDVTPKLTNLEDLRLKARRPDEFHANCPYSRVGIYSDVNYPFFDVDFASLARLKVLEIEGICNHVPIQNLVGPNLRSLRLHQPSGRYSVISSESQRSPLDLVTAARIAPRIERLELDIGYVENLWHPTAIPGVDVDVDLYRFLAALSNFKSLKVLRLFPPYVAKEAIQPHSTVVPAYQQPLSDEQAIRMFNQIRRHCPQLELFSASVSPMGIRDAMDFSPMNWEVRPWGDKILMTTRQLGKDYELRQVWVGERRLTWETRRHAYSKKHMPDPEDWLLTRVHPA